MKKILLQENYGAGPTIMVFAEGTILRPRTWLQLYNHNAYVPIGDSVRIIGEWQKQGANIIYCTSRRENNAEDMASLLRRFGFAGVFLAARERKEKYSDIVEALKPDVLIEDDCKSIGGAWQMCITKVRREIRSGILSVVVPEFRGIDALPTLLEDLKRR